MDDMEGGGTEEDPYKIESFEQLQTVRQRLGAYYKLISDIDANNLEPEEFEPIGDRRNPFTGTLNGNNYEIHNLCINQPEMDGVGLFSCIGEKGQVENLGLITVNITGENKVGSFAGTNYGQIDCLYAKEVHISGRVSIGSLVGRNYGKIESSYAVNVDVPGEYYVGGLVGRNYYGKLESSYVQAGDVSGGENIGGLVGRYYNGKLESSCTIKLDISGGAFVGGLVGCNRNGEVKLSHTVDNSVSGEKFTGDLLGYGSRESCFTMSSSDESNILYDADLVLSIGNHRISYVMGTKNLYLQINNNKLYSRRDVSPIEMQSLVEETEVVKMTQKFMSSVVSTI